MKKGCFAGWCICWTTNLQNKPGRFFFLLLLPSSSMFSLLFPLTHPCKTRQFLHFAPKYLQRCQDGAWEQLAPRRETATGEAALCSAPSGRTGDCVQRGRQRVLWHFWGEWRTYRYFLLPKAAGIKRRRALVTLSTTTELSMWRTQIFIRIRYKFQPSIPTLQPDIGLFIEEWTLHRRDTPPFISIFQ